MLRAAGEFLEDRRVLSVTGTTLIYYSSTNARSAEYSADNTSAYELAEAGVHAFLHVAPEGARESSAAADPATLNAYGIALTDSGAHGEAVEVPGVHNKITFQLEK